MFTKLAPPFQATPRRRHWRSKKCSPFALFCTVLLLLRLGVCRRQSLKARNGRAPFVSFHFPTSPPPPGCHPLSAPVPAGASHPAPAPVLAPACIISGPPRPPASLSRRAVVKSCYVVESKGMAGAADRGVKAKSEVLFLLPPARTHSLGFCFTSSLTPCLRPRVHNVYFLGNIVGFKVMQV